MSGLQPHHRRLAFEPLEDRRLLAITVDTIGDVVDGGDGLTSLREAISLANGSIGADTITFSPLFDTAQTISLGSQLPTITDDLTIIGTGANLLTLDAGDGIDNMPGSGDGYRIFNIDDGTGIQIDVTLSGLKLTGGDVTGNGGAILNRENVTVTSSTLSGNTATRGGGIYNSGTANVTLTSSTLSGNTATFSGGGFFNTGTANVTSSTLSGNTATVGGSIYNLGAANVTSSTLSGNMASSGGGIFNNTGTANVTNSTLSGNTATNGGGIFNYLGTANVTSSTLSGNTAAFSGGGIYNSPFGVTTINGSIVAGSPSGGDIVNNGFLSGSYNLIQDGSGAGLTSTIAGDPLLGSLTDNVGPTPTHALLFGSPAIDAGFSTETNDQRGAPFLRNDGNGVDIGAYERQTVATINLVVDTLGDVVDGGDGLTSLREAIRLANGSIGADTITFSPLFDTAQTISLGSQLPTIFDALTITGTGANLLTLDAGDGIDNMPGTGDGYRIFNIDDGTGTQIDVTLSGLKLTGGDANGSGGAILNLENVTLTGSTISGNTASGGGIHNSGTANVTSSTLSGNTATSSGGGIYSSGTTNVTGSTLSGNTAAFAGGGFFNSGTANVTSSTISGNTAVFSGGGISNFLFGTATINGSIVAGSPSGGDIVNTGSLSGSYNLIQDGSGAGLTSTIAGDPLLGSLADNGGPTQTHALLPASPAIDAGDPAIASPPEYDQRGFAFNRIVAGNIDIGTFEAGATSADFDTDGDVDGIDFLVWQRGFGSTPVVHSVGDANVDNAVDAVDLSVWETTFGMVEPSPLVAAVASGQSPAALVEASSSRALTSQIAQVEMPSATLSATPANQAVATFAPAELIDAAMAMTLLDRTIGDDEIVVVQELHSAETFFDKTFAPHDLVPPYNGFSFRAAMITRSAEPDETSVDGFSDDVVDEVFQRVFG